MGEIGDFCIKNALIYDEPSLYLQLYCSLMMIFEVRFCDHHYVPNSRFDHAQCATIRMDMVSFLINSCCVSSHSILLKVVVIETFHSTTGVGSFHVYPRFLPNDVRRNLGLT